MVTREEIQTTCDDIVREFTPLQIILFGSHAYGTPSEYSDVDLLVVMSVDNSDTRSKASEIRERIPDRFRMDLLVLSPEEMAYRISYNDWFLREVNEKGIVLYESDDFYYKPHKKEITKMNPLTLEWIEKAEGDLVVAKENQSGENPINHVICFLAQQCAEKYLKAWLQENNIPIQRTHNLDELLNLIIPTIPVWNNWKADISKLSEYAVETRYLGRIPTDTDAEHAINTCEKVRQEVWANLKLPIEENKDKSV